MIEVFKSAGEELVKTTVIGEKGSWVNLIDPTEEEIVEVARSTNIIPEFLKAPLDAEERSRIESEENQALVLIHIPIAQQHKRNVTYETIPLGIVITDDLVVTVCLQENPILSEFSGNGKPRSFYTFKKTRFLLQILHKTAQLYLRYLKQIDRQTSEIEQRLHHAMRNEELIKLLNLEKSLVYFTTSLRSNEVVMEKLLGSTLPKVDPESRTIAKLIKMYEEDEDLLEDVIIENKQAMEMGTTYSTILGEMMDAFASIISNNVNIVMKFLTSATIILSFPTMVASFYGMNVALPFQHIQYPYVFLIPLVSSLILSSLTAIVLARKRML